MSVWDTDTVCYRTLSWAVSIGNFSGKNVPLIYGDVEEARVKGGENKTEGETRGSRGGEEEGVGGGRMKERSHGTRIVYNL